MVVNGFWDSKNLSSLPYHLWLCLGSRYHHHHPHHQTVWIGKDFKGSMLCSERLWQFVGTSCPRPAQVEPRYNQVAPPSPLTSASPMLWTMEIDSSWWEDRIFGGSLSFFLTIVPLSTSHHSHAAACSTLCILGMLLQHVCFQAWINEYPYGRSPTWCENWEQKTPWPPSHGPSRAPWEEMLGGCRSLWIAHPAQQPTGAAISIALPRLEAIALAYIMYSWLPLMQCRKWKRAREPKCAIIMSTQLLVR